jgi:modified peptide precursor CbpA
VPADALYLSSENAMKQTPNPKPDTHTRPAEPRPDMIAIRKTCDAEGTGLSHYVLMDKQVKR